MKPVSTPERINPRWKGLYRAAVPSTAGALGMVFSLASLVPWAVFAVMAARQFRRFAAQA